MTAVFKYALFRVHYTLLDNNQQRTSLDFYAKEAMREIIQKKRTHNFRTDLSVYEKKHVRERSLSYLLFY